MDSLTERFAARREDFEHPVLVTGSGGCIGSWTLAIENSRIDLHPFRIDRFRPWIR